MQVEVHLLSGSGFSISLSPETPIRELKAAAQQHFQRGFLKLFAKGQPLDLTATLSQAGLRDGDVVDAVVQPVQAATTEHSLCTSRKQGRDLGSRRLRRGQQPSARTAEQCPAESSD